MALGATITGVQRASAIASGAIPTVPVSQVCSWVDCIKGTNCLITGDNGGSTVIAAFALIAGGQATSFLVAVQGGATQAKIRLAYDKAHTPTTPLVIQPFGFDIDPTLAPGTLTARQPEALFDANSSNTLSFSVAASTDATDTSFAYTPSQFFDLLGNAFVLLAIKTPLTENGGLVVSSKMQIAFL